VIKIWPGKTQFLGQIVSHVAILVIKSMKGHENAIAFIENLN
jgi:hypothetical protein